MASGGGDPWPGRRCPGQAPHGYGDVGHHPPEGERWLLSVGTVLAAAGAAGGSAVVEDMGGSVGLLSPRVVGLGGKAARRRVGLEDVAGPFEGAGGHSDQLVPLLPT